LRIVGRISANAESGGTFSRTRMQIEFSSSGDATEMRYALEGIKILDLSQMWAVPGSGMYLADQGAEVIKVEPKWGDEGRRLLTASPIETEKGPVTRHFLPLNRNKRSIVIDITTDEGREILYKLAENADVMLQNYRPEVRKRLKVDYETMHGINPRLIYLDFSPFGLKGPHVNKPAYDRVVQAMSGIHGRRYLPDGTPLAGGVWVADCATPILIAYAVALALLMREKTGQGQRIEVSLLGGTIAMQSVEMVRAEREKASPARSYADQAMFAPYAVQDGKWLIVIIVQDREFARLCKVLDLEHLANDPKFVNSAKRAENSEVLYPIVSAAFSTKSRDEWLKLLEEADVPCAPILTPAEVFDHPQMVENELIVEVDDPRVGKVKMMGIPLKLADAPGSIRRLAPDLGQHTDEILLEAGYDKAHINQLRQKNIIT